MNARAKQIAKHLNRAPEILRCILSRNLKGGMGTGSMGALAKVRYHSHGFVVSRSGELGLERSRQYLAGSERRERES